MRQFEKCSTAAEVSEMCVFSASSSLLSHANGMMSSIFPLDDNSQSILHNTLCSVVSFQGADYGGNYNTR